LESNGNKLIIGIEKLADYLGVSKPTVSAYIQLGMPCGRVGNRWHFHLENVDRWLKNDLTNARYEGKEDPEKLEDSETENH
jgi:excisionase family DNA binding protein